VPEKSSAFHYLLSFAVSSRLLLNQVSGGRFDVSSFARDIALFSRDKEGKRESHAVTSRIANEGSCRGCRNLLLALFEALLVQTEAKLGESRIYVDRSRRSSFAPVRASSASPLLGGGGSSSRSLLRAKPVADLLVAISVSSNRFLVPRANPLRDCAKSRSPRWISRCRDISE